VGGMKVLVMASEHRIFSMSVARVYPLYVAKLERKGRTQAELDVVIKWLTGYTAAGLAKVLKNETDFKTFFAKAPKMNPSKSKASSAECGSRKSKTRPCNQFATSTNWSMNLPRERPWRKFSGHHRPNDSRENQNPRPVEAEGFRS
jgi:hypothetical protein